MPHLIMNLRTPPFYAVVLSFKYESQGEFSPGSRYLMPFYPLVLVSQCLCWSNIEPRYWCSFQSLCIHHSTKNSLCPYRASWEKYDQLNKQQNYLLQITSSCCIETYKCWIVWGRQFFPLLRTQTPIRIGLGEFYYTIYEAKHYRRKTM